MLHADRQCRILHYMNEEHALNDISCILQGMGTDEDELNRVVISRCEVDMIQIKEQYEELMKRSLEDHVSVCHILNFTIISFESFRKIQVVITEEFLWNY